MQFKKPVEGDALFPMLPYGGVFYQNDEEGIPNPNPNLSAKELGSIEQQVVAPDRRDQLKPYFDMTYGPIFFDTSTNVAFNGGFARTPLGLLAELNPCPVVARPREPSRVSCWRAARRYRINTVAQAPAPTESSTRSSPTPSSTTICSWSPPTRKPSSPSHNKIKLGDFTFRIDLGDGDSKTIALFKFVPGVSARTLIGDTDAWDTLIKDLPRRRSRRFRNDSRII